jgi:lysophospholipase L1-like esterase
MAPGKGNQPRVPVTLRLTAHPWGRLPALAIVMLMIGACSTATASPVASPAALVPSATAPPSQTAQPTALPSSSPTPSPTLAGPHLTYVALGDSLLFALEEDCDSCTSAVVIYGKQVETDLGMPVEVHNLTMHNGLKTPGLLAYLKDGVSIGRTAENARTAVAAADIVSITIGFNDSTLSDKDNLAAFVNEYAATLDAILGEVDALRAGKPTMVRVTTIYNNGIAEKPELDPDGPGSGVNGWKPIVEAQNTAICDVAAKHKATCVDIYEPFNGKDGLSSPLAKGYIAPDGVHPSQLGMDVIAAALVGGGYKPLR